MPLLADLNVYCYSFQRILAPHTAHGPFVRDETYFSEHDDAYHQNPRDIGAPLGAIMYVSASEWRRVEARRRGMRVVADLARGDQVRALLRGVLGVDVRALGRYGNDPLGLLLLLSLFGFRSLFRHPRSMDEG